MFDIAFSELMLIGIVALVVIGPERLPKVARMAGHLLGRMQRYVSDVKADINREIQLDELRQLRADVQDSARNLEMSVRNEMQAVETAVGQQVQSARAALDDLAATSPASATEAPAAPVATPIAATESGEAPGSGAAQQPVEKA
jgi:sec-independent protein translocase protein TatB